MKKITKKHVLAQIDKAISELNSSQVTPPDYLVDALSETTLYSKAIKSQNVKTSISLKSYQGRASYFCLNIHLSTGATISVVKKMVKLKNAKPRESKTCTRKQNNLKIMRDAILPQIQEFKTTSRLLAKKGHKEFTICRLSGKKLFSGEVHVDHRIPFCKLVELWVEYYTTPKDLSKINMNRQSYLDSWVSFHNTFALLDLTLGTHNIRAGAKGY